MKTLTPQEIQFVSSSLCGRDGRLFEWQDGLYCAIAAERSLFFEKLFQEGIVDHLISNNFLIESAPAPVTLPGYGLVVKHRRVPFVSYPFEWCDQALKDAAAFLLDLNLELLQFGLMTRDAHPRNILFEGTRPIFVNLGAIVPEETVDSAKWVKDFRSFFSYPLHLFSDGQYRIARLCLQDWKDRRGGVHRRDFIRLTERNLARRYLSKQANRVIKAVPYPLKEAYQSLCRGLAKLVKPAESPLPPSNGIQTRKRYLERLKEEIEAIELAVTVRWDYYGHRFKFPSLTDSQDWSPKNLGVANVLKMTNPGCVVDIGSNRGWYSLLAAQLGADVVALDISESLVSRLYKDACNCGLSVQPLVMNFLWPSPSMGLLDSWAPATKRLKSDMAMALALVHHLVHRYNLQFDHVVDGLSKFTKRWFLTEFIPYGDPSLSVWVDKEHGWYSLDNFLAALERRFKIIEVTQSYPPVRTLIFCEQL